MEKANKLPKLSESQKKEQVLRFIQQKREMYATGIYFNAVRGSDALLEILYPLKQEGNGGK